MRIAFAIYGSLDLVSGGFAYDRALIDQLVRLGHQVDVLALPWLNYGRALVSPLGGVSRTLAVRAASCDVIVEDELIHPSLSGRASFWGTRAAGSHRPWPPRVSLIHNLKSEQPGERHRWLKRMVERRYLRGLDGVIAVCQETLTSARSLAGRELPAVVARPGRDHLLPGPPLDDAFVTERLAGGGPLRILHVAAVVPHKGLHRLIAALAGLPPGTFELDVVGTVAAAPAYVRAVTTQATQAGIASRIRWHAEQHGQALSDLYRRSHLFALPSDREAYSLACLEALGFGLPLLATDQGGLREMVASSQAGLLLPPDDLPAWTDALFRLGADRPRLATMAAAALRRHRQHDTWREVALSVQGFLEQVVSGRPPPASRARTGPG